MGLMTPLPQDNVHLRTKGGNDHILTAQVIVTIKTRVGSREVGKCSFTHVKLLKVRVEF
jgi:hypothetical protein